jgi:hypothetical protein
VNGEPLEDAAFEERLRRARGARRAGAETLAVATEQF